MKERIRVVVAEPGRAEDDRGAQVVALALRDAGMEVVHAGRRQTPEQIVAAVIEEDADAVGVSVVDGNSGPLVRLAGLLCDSGADDVVLFGSGTVPEDDVAGLARLGVAHVFDGATTPEQIVDWLRRRVGAPG